MASILRKSLKDQLFSASRITTNLSNPTILSSKPILTSPLANHQDSSFLGQTPTFLQQDSNLNVGFYPSFCFGQFLNPVSSNGLILTHEDNAVADEPESVSKKIINRSRTSFSCGHFRNLVSSNGLILTGEDNVIADESESESKKMWADSVKKKRKRKMNKHKLKKLRKHLRRKTKT